MSNELFELPEGWLWSTWEEIGFCQNGRAFPSKEYQSSGVKLLRPGNMHDSGKLIWTEENTRYMPEQWKIDFPSYIVKGRELVINLTAQSLKDEFLGRICLTDESEHCLLNQRIARLAPVEVFPEYILWLFKSKLFRNYVDSLNTGSLIQHMFTSQIEKFKLPLAPLNEQKRIVAKIEELRDRHQRAKQALEAIPELCDRFRQSVLAAAFRGDLTADWREENTDIGWREFTLEEVIKGKPRNGYSPKPVDYPTKVKSLTLSATTSGKFKPEHFKYIDEEIEADSHLWLNPNDILIQRSNTLEYVGTSAIYNGIAGEFIYPDLMMKIQVIEEKVKPEFIHYLLSSRTTREYFKNNATGTAGNMPKINQQIVMNTPVAIPSIEEQEQIISRIQDCFKAIDCIQQQQRDAQIQLARLNQAILAKAFRGELVEQDPNDEPASVLLERILAEREKADNGKKTKGKRAKGKRAKQLKLEV